MDGNAPCGERVEKRPNIFYIVNIYIPLFYFLVKIFTILYIKQG